MGIDILRVRAEQGGNVEEVRNSEQSRFRKVDTVGATILADQKWRQEQFQLEKLRADLTKLQKVITDKKKESKGQDKCEPELAQKTQMESVIADQEKVVEEALSVRDLALHKIGNIVDPDVVISKDEADNKVIRTWGNPRMLDVDGKTKGRLHHHQVLQLLGFFEQDPRGINIAGHRGYFLRGWGVVMNMALMNYGMTFLMKKGYLPLQPPFFMKKSIMAETAELGDFDDQLYKVSEYTDKRKAELGLTKDEGEYYLIATSEQPISAYHRREWLQETELPKKYVGVSSCFRKEAGSHGKDTWGIFRVHQFEKIEQFCITTAEKSKELHEEMIAISEEFLQSLELPYQTISIVSGALNDAAAKKYDVEAWFPGQNCFRELVSCSNCTDFQARAMETRCGHAKQGEREKKYVHMLNGTLCATERTMCCIAENYQTETGLRVPKVLQPYMQGMEFIPYEFDKIQETKHQKD
jgi:seryl-tRNA synthetase